MNERELAEILLKIKAVELRPEKPFRYASGLLGPIYTDNRLLMAYPDKRRAVRDSFIGLMEQRHIEADVIAGTATAGIPHAAWIADRLEKPMVYVRGSQKSHGKENLIEGIMKPGQKVVLIEDLINSGGSSIAAANAIEEQGGIVKYCLAIFTYGLEKASRAFEESDFILLTLTNLKTLVDVATEKKLLGNGQKETILDWAEDPEGWGKKHGFD